MICVLVKIKVKKDRQKEFERIFKSLSKEIKEKERGNIFYQVAKDRENPLKYVILENFLDTKSIKKPSTT